MAGPVAEEIAAVAATTNYISNEAAKSKGRKNFATRSTRLLSDTALEEPSAKDSMVKYNKVKSVSCWGVNRVIVIVGVLTGLL